MQSVSLQTAKAPYNISHGRYIYAYCHVRTNQVVYSLSRNLKNRPALNQLPDLGANNTDASLRKDLWKPLYTLCLPSDEPHNLRQGLHAFKKLREYRMLHETSWTPSPLLAKPFTATDIARLENELSQRGGSKTESVYDIITRKKKKMRVKTVQDQRANSIADLAAVLLEQEELGTKTSGEKEATIEKDRQSEVKEMLALAAEAEGGALEKLGAEIQEIRTRMEVVGTEEEKNEGVSKKQMRRELYKLVSRKLRMEFAATAVAEANGSSPQVGSTTEEQRASATAQDSATGATATGEPDYATVLPSFPSRDTANIPKRGLLKQKLRRLAAPIFSTEGITVKWHNILDAEFAAAWPESVMHERMGWSRNTAPRGDQPSIDDAGAFKETQWKRRPANWLPAPSEDDVDDEGEVDGQRAEEERVRLEKEARAEFVQRAKDDALRRVGASEARARLGSMLSHEAGRAEVRPDA